MKTTSHSVFACKSRACAPPPIGTGGSIPANTRAAMGGVRVRVGNSSALISKRPKTVVAEDSPHYVRRSDQRSVSEARAREMMDWHSDTKRVAERGEWPKDGQVVGVRANLKLIGVIKAKTGEKVIVQTLHEVPKGDRLNPHTVRPGRVINNGMAFTLRDVVFRVNQQARAKIAAGEVNKFPMASVDGKYVSKPNKSTMFDGIEVRFNPKSTHLFVDPDGRPIKSAEEVTVVGSSVFVRGRIEYYDQSDYPDPVRGLPTTVVLGLDCLVSV